MNRVELAERVRRDLCYIGAAAALIIGVLLTSSCATKNPVHEKIPENPPPKFHVTLRGSVNGKCTIVDVLKDAHDPLGQIWICKEGLK
jgi:hypothetical protein